MREHPPSPKIETTAIFSKIAVTYDLVNCVLSFGTDHYWRRKLLAKISHSPTRRLQVLDLATGTGEVALLLARLPQVDQVIAVDPAAAMLKIARKKARMQSSRKNIAFLMAAAENTGLPSNQFDLITIAFGIRNFARPTLALAECQRLLRPGGQLLILEFSTPESWWWRMAYLFYFRHILPMAGRLMSGHPSAYHYLNQSAEIFPSGERFLQLMADAGIKIQSATPLTGGITTIYQGQKG